MNLNTDGLLASEVERLQRKFESEIESVRLSEELRRKLTPFLQETRYSSAEVARVGYTPENRTLKLGSSEQVEVKWAYSLGMGVVTILDDSIFEKNPSIDCKECERSEFFAVTPKAMSDGWGLLVSKGGYAKTLVKHCACEESFPVVVHEDTGWIPADGRDGFIVPGFDLSGQSHDVPVDNFGIRLDEFELAEMRLKGTDSSVSDEGWLCIDTFLSDGVAERGAGLAGQELFRDYPPSVVRKITTLVDRMIATGLMNTQD